MANELGEILRGQKRVFTEAGTESPALSAELLLAHALGVERQELLHLLLMEPRRVLGKLAIERFASYAERRLLGEPVAYITGCKEFYGREFTVTPATLIPRPETELIIDKALELFGNRHTQQPSGGFLRENTVSSGKRRFADFGTGSGCLAVTLALELNRASALPQETGGGQGPQPENEWSGLALDISPEALEVAARNAEKLGAAGTLTFMQADFALPLPQLSASLGEAWVCESLDLLVSNPPYVSEAEYRNLAVEVRSFEPKGALVPAAASLSPAGNELLPAVCNAALRQLKPGGVLLMEIGHDQGGFMRELLSGQSAAAPDSPHAPASDIGPVWREWQVLQDLAGLDRTVFARKK